MADFRPTQAEYDQALDLYRTNAGHDAIADALGWDEDQVERLVEVEVEAKPDEALAVYETALAVFEALIRKFPRVPDARDAAMPNARPSVFAFVRPTTKRICVSARSTTPSSFLSDALFSSTNDSAAASSAVDTG